MGDGNRGKPWSASIGKSGPDVQRGREGLVFEHVVGRWSGKGKVQVQEGVRETTTMTTHAHENVDRKDE